jgi:hypothetical protein
LTEYSLYSPFSFFIKTARDLPLDRLLFHFK